MNIWRMKLRAGNHGEDMLPLCRGRGIAAITYQPIFNTNLTHANRSDLDARIKTAARTSMYRFAWEIKGGDEILVGDSKCKRIVARGYVTSTPGHRAYRFNDRNPITEPNNPNAPWRHEVPVLWDSEFEPFRYRDGAPLITVMHFDSSWARSDGEGSFHPGVPDETEDMHERRPLSESGYVRQTHASLCNDRLHAALSNRFREWVKDHLSAKAAQERNRVDVMFEHGGLTHLAELKICYGADTKAAIREAMGQLLEYNHYPPRSAAQSWWLVLDQQPAVDDRRFISVLRERYSFPLRIAWAVDHGFKSFPEWPAK